jgi:hypothetical protein
MTKQIERISEGDKVLIDSGHKHVGETGVVFWIGIDKFNNPEHYGDCSPKRAGIRSSDGRVFFVSAANVGVIAG